MGSAARTPEFSFRKMLLQEMPALGKPLRVGKNNPDLLGPAF